MRPDFKINRLILLFLLALIGVPQLVGCGEPALHPVSGKVTLGGSSYNRLLVYFRPVDGSPQPYNMGVGETDAQGNLSLRSTAGMGMATGKYRVFFSCMTVKGQRGGVGMDEKADDDRRTQVVEIVPEIYRDENTSPVEFEITAGDNEFIFDIPRS